MKRLEEYLSFHAANAGGRTAFVCGNDQVTYAQLYTLAKERSLLYLRQERKVVLVRTSQSIDFIITYFAAHLAGKTLIPLEKDLPESLFNQIELLVNKSVMPESVTDILFTTGTAGVPKGVMLSHRAIAANAENLIEAQGFANNVTFIISGPLNHIGSLSKIWPMIVVGGTVVITEGIKDINAFFAALEASQYKVATFLVPASLRMLLQFGKRDLCAYAGKLDFIETGAAPMAQSDMEELCGILPHTRLYNTYASTETGIVATHDYCHDGCISGCLGKPMKHASIQITPEGTIACAGPMLMSGYLGDERLTSSVLRNHVLYTSDVGYMDEFGRLRLAGRKDDIINIGGYKVSPVEVENVAMAFLNIVDCICVCSKHPVIGGVLKLIYVVSEGHSFEQKVLINYLKLHLESYKVPFLYEQTDKIERTYNGKLNRKFYRE